MKMRIATALPLLALTFLLPFTAQPQAIDHPAPPQPPLIPALTPGAPATPPVVVAPPAPQPNFGDLATSVIAWNTLDKAVSVDFGTPNAEFNFSFTNVSTEPVVIQMVRTSCGCTTAKLPTMPWTIPPGSNDVLNLNMNLMGKAGTVVKSVTVQTDKGMKNLLVRCTILQLQSSTAMASGMREQNQVLALADPQAIFKGDCASCHVEPARGKLGGELYTAACGICHEAEHRASTVPDLKVAKQERNAEYWRNWITSGKQGTMMPAFAATKGGFLTDEQIGSLVEHLMKTMPTKPMPPQHAGGSVPAPAAH
jgi:mono/diheme cytochrome c family protein